MNLIKELSNKFGTEITNGLALNLGAGNDSVKKSMEGTLPALMGGLINKVQSKAGAAELHKLLNTNEYDGSLLNKVGNLFSGSESINLLKNGLDVLPMVLGGQSKMGTVLNIAGSLFGGGLSRSQSVFGMLAPVLLNFIGKKMRTDKLNQKGLVDLLLGQKEYVQKNTHKDIAKEMGFAKWDSSQSLEEEPTDEVANEETFYDAYQSSKPKRSFPKWLIPFGIIVGFIAALFLLTKACGEIPEEKQKAMDAKKAQREEQRTQQQSKQGQTNQTLTNTKPTQPNRNVPAKPKANNTEPIKTNPNNQNQTNSNVTTNRPNNTSQTNANTTPNNTATKPTTGGRKGIQNQTPKTPKTAQTDKPQQPAKPQTQPATNNTAQNDNRPATNTTTTNPSTQTGVKQNTSPPPVTRPGVKQNTSTNATKASTSKYRGSAGIVDKAARSGGTQIINFGTVTTDNQTLTRSAENNFKKIAQIMKDNPSTKISIRAHNQDYKNPTQNANAKKTGTVRANLLKQLLVNEGVQVNRILVESLGNTEFLISEDKGNARNQRISVKVN